MTAQEYISKRVQDQIQWYNTKSGWNQKQYKRYKLIVIILSVTIPFLAGLITEFGLPLTIMVGLMGVAIAIIEGIQALYKYQENWLEYRRTAESLYREQLLFEAGTGPYKEDQSVQLLVERCETIMGMENQKWQEIQMTKTPEANNS